MSDTILELRNLKRTYTTGQGRLEVLKGVNLEVRAGEVVGLVGPSGSGKSSLLHAAGLLERPSGGQIIFEGRDCGALSDAERTKIRLRGIGFVYQFHHLLPEFSALDNVAMPLMIAGRSPALARKRSASLLDALGLSQRLRHQPAQLSGGEAQRIAVARALANRPRLLLADEPTGNLDPATSEALFAGLHDLVRQNGVGALIATHNHGMIKHMDRVMVLKDGRLVEATGA
ncbi:MAG TPA: ABC transporter ATP-binding protein [Caulobacteraceae bacterium]